MRVHAEARHLFCVVCLDMEMEEEVRSPTHTHAHSHGMQTGCRCTLLLESQREVHTGLKRHLAQALTEGVQVTAAAEHVRLSRGAAGRQMYSIAHGAKLITQLVSKRFAPKLTQSYHTSRHHCTPHILPSLLRSGVCRGCPTVLR